MSAEVDFDLLADYVGGALEGTPEHDRVAGFIEQSPAWRQAAEDLSLALGAVTSDLAVLRGYPEKMPDDLALRFDELLSAPALAPAPSTAPRPGVGERTLTRRAPTPTRGVRRWLAPISVAAGVLAIAGLAISSWQAPRSQNDSPTAGRDTSSSYESLDSAASVPVIQSGQDYSSDTGGFPTRMTASGVPQLATSTVQPVAPMTDKNGTAKSTADSWQLGGCLGAVSRSVPGGQIRLVDYATFEHQPAYVISVTWQGHDWMIVTTPSCSNSDSHEIFRKQLR